jgi:hypothetical protein
MQIDVISWIEELSLTFMGIPDDQTHYLWNFEAYLG